MSTIKQIITLIVLVVLLSVAYMFRDSIPTPPAQQPTEPVVDGTGSDTGGDAVFCTMDAMQCPDGTYVGRTGPNCEFVCPSSSPASSAAGGGATSLYEKFTVGLDEPRVIGPLTVTPIKLEQDSRCPADVMCIQAGTATVSVKLYQEGVIDSARVIEIGKSTVVGDLEITLSDVQPYPLASKTPSWRDYRFTFEVRGR